MNIKSSRFFSVLLLALFLTGTAHAQKTPPGEPAEESTEIQDSTPDVNEQPETVVKETVVGDDELPSESVIPITDNNSSVLNKKVKFAKHFQLDLGTGSVLDEPLINANYFIIRASYYTTEEYSFGLGLRSRFGGKTTYSEQLGEGSARLEFQRAPQPTTSNFVSFGYNFYYGKISLGKNVVVPAATKLDTDFGMQTFGTTSKPFLQSAITQSFFVGNHVAVGLSIGVSLAQTYDSTSVNIRSTQPIPSESAFSTKMQTNQYLSVNLNTVF